MAFDFPDNPSIGTVYGDYTWDGEKWAVTSDGSGGGGGTPSDTNPIMDGVAAPGVSDNYSRGDHVHPTDTSRAAASAIPIPATAVPLIEGTAAVGVSVKYAREDHVHPASGGGGGITDAPSDGKTYGRLNGAWSQALAITGGTLTGPLTLAADPASVMQAATKQYVDANSMTQAVADARYVNITGDTMTGGVNTPASSVNQLGDVYAIRSANTGIVFFGSNIAQYIYFDGTQFLFQGAPIQASLNAASAAVTAAPGDNDTSVATTAFVQAALAAAGGGGFPAGTKTVFYQAAAPTGWTRITTVDDVGLRVVGSGGAPGGAVQGTSNFSVVFSQTVTGNTTLLQSQIPSHTHTVNQSTNAGVLGNTSGGSANFWYAYAGTFNAGVTGGDGAHSHPVTLNLKFVDLILASKN
jgi:hypothetical protein